MTDGGGTGADRGELAALRARAYGPHADITTDPDAMRRLAALERAATARLRPSSATPSRSSRAAAGEGDRTRTIGAALPEQADTPAASRTSPPPDASAPAATGPSRPPARLPRRSWWRSRAALSNRALVLIVAALCVAGAGAVLAVRQAPSAATSRPVAQLRLGAQANDTPRMSAEVRTVFASWGADPKTTRVSERFGQAFAWVAHTRGGQTCLLLAVGAPVEIANGSASLIPGGCAPAGQEPSVDLWSGDPGNARLLQGTVDARSWVRFRPDGDHVQVWVTSAPSGT